MALTAPGDMCACRPWPVDPDMCCEEWPRPWPIPPEVPPEEYTAEQRRALKARAMASEKLWSLTAYQWGLCEDLVRPCGPSDCRPVGYAGSPPGAYLAGGRMYNSACGCACADCELGCTIRLPGPVNEVLAVTLGHETLEPETDYFVNGEGGLVKTEGCWPHCFPSGTLVLTDDGHIPIEDVQPGMKVLTHENRWKTVTWAGQSGVSPLVSTKGPGGELRSTPEHKVWAAEILANYDSKTRARRKADRKVGAPEWVPARETIGMGRAIPVSIPALPVPLPGGFTELPDNFWWFIGRWIGDGWTDSSPRSSRVVVCCGAHERDDLAAELGRTGWAWRETSDKMPGYADRPRFRFSSKGLHTWLREQFGTTAHNKRLPSWVFGMPEDDRKMLLDGYVSADGSSQSNSSGRGLPTTSTATVSRELAVCLKLLAASLGYGPSMYEGKRPKYRRLPGERQTSGTRAIPYRVNWSQRKIGEAYSQFYDAPGPHAWAPVREIVVLDEAVPVFDITVEEDHSFIADGYVVHNSQDMTAACGEPGSFCVRYLRGLNPESSLHAIRAVSALACSYYQTMCGGQCRSLVGAKRVTRGGVTYETEPSGVTGVGPADEWLNMVNPTGRRRMPMVLSPDMRRWIYRGASECGREVTS